MKEQLEQLKVKLLELNEKLTFGQKISIAAVLVATFAIIAAVILTSSGEEYSYLFTNLTPDDSAAIVENLNKDKIPYKLTNNGAAISVPSKNVLDIRLKLASSGLPRGAGVGYEIFDTQDVTTLTEFTEHVNMIRAIQGELSRTISNLAPVKSARVHIVMPKESMFVEDQKDATASVMVNLYNGRSLSGRHVNSIVHLVSSSVEGLKAEKVTIVDNMGNVLNGDGDDLEGLSAKKLAYKRNVEKRFEENILKLVNPIMGKGKSRVTVNADLDFDKGERQEEKYNPNITAVRSETKLEEMKENNKSQPGGLAGTQSNLPGRAGQAVNQGEGSKSQLEKSTTNYEINKTVRNVKENVGSIRRVNVSVVLDGISKKVGEKTEVVPVSDEQVKNIEEIVKTAVGFDLERGDKVVVTSIPFAEKEEIAEIPWFIKYLPYLKYLLPWIVLLIIMLVAVRPLIKSIRRIVPSPVTTEGVVLEEGEFEEGAEEVTGEGRELTQEEKELAALEAKLEETMGITMSREQLLAINFARKNPDVTIKIIKKWMKEK